jgi:hypothetical protein
MSICGGFLRELIPRTLIPAGSSDNVRFRAVRQGRSDAPEKLFLNFCDTAHRGWLPLCVAFEDRDTASNWRCPWAWLEARSSARPAENNQRRLGPFDREGFCSQCLARNSASGSTMRHNSEISERTRVARMILSHPEIDGGKRISQHLSNFPPETFAQVENDEGQHTSDNPTLSSKRKHSWKFSVRKNQW